MLNNSLSTLSPEDRAALDALTGGLVEDRPIAVDPVDLSIAYAVSGVRGQIVAEAKTKELVSANLRDGWMYLRLPLVGIFVPKAICGYLRQFFLPML